MVTGRYGWGMKMCTKLLLTIQSVSLWSLSLRRWGCLWIMRRVWSPFMTLMLQLLSTPLLAAASLTNSTHSSVHVIMLVVKTLLLWSSLLSITLSRTNIWFSTERFTSFNVMNVFFLVFVSDCIQCVFILFTIDVCLWCVTLIFTSTTHQL